MFRTRPFIVRSKTKRPENPARCWHDINTKKLEYAASLNSDYTFEYTIDNQVFRYSYPARDLLTIFQQKSVRIKDNESGYQWSFFGEYQTGRIFRDVTPNDRDVVVQLNAQV